jgi:hypothetical protein
LNIIWTSFAFEYNIIVKFSPCEVDSYYLLKEMVFTVTTDFTYFRVFSLNVVSVTTFSLSFLSHLFGFRGLNLKIN